MSTVRTSRDHRGLDRKPRFWGDDLMKRCRECFSTYPMDFRLFPHDGTALVELRTWSPGSVIRGRYRILDRAGQGGMGTVYKARHVTCDKECAIKVIRRELLREKSQVRRFKMEAVNMRKLCHPNIVRVENIDEAEDGRPFIVMEYIEGQTLKQLMQNSGYLPVPRVCTIMKQVASALDAAHRLGIVHRDIKPANIIIRRTPDRELAKVLDFGIAKIKEVRDPETTADLTVTGLGMVIGTPEYLSPEQVIGRHADELDGRSDLYSLGVVMYQMLTGDLPFKADTAIEMLIAYVRNSPVPIRHRPESQIPDRITRLVMNCLEKQRESRPPSAKAVIKEIERAEGEMVQNRKRCASCEVQYASPS